MKTNFVSISNAIKDFVDDTGLSHDEINDKQLTKWAADCIQWFSTDQQLRHRIVILQVEHSRAELPPDYQILTQAAARPFEQSHCDCVRQPEKACCQETGRRSSTFKRTRREHVSQWIQQSLGEECEIEINLICPKCRKNACTCGSRSFEVDVDRIWEAAHPEIYYQHFNKIGRFGYGENTSYYSPDFQLMRYATNNFHNIAGVISDCPNFGCAECEHEFKINPPYIDVDFNEGEILLSYLGKALDAKGEYMIPDHPSAHQAVFHYLRYKWNLLRCDSRNDAMACQRSEDSYQKYNIHLSQARAALEIPNAEELRAYFQNSSWLKRIPNWFHDYANKMIPDQYKHYLTD